jgi:hypothetical protein
VHGERVGLVAGGRGRDAGDRAAPAVHVEREGVLLRRRQGGIGRARRRARLPVRSTASRAGPSSALMDGDRLGAALPVQRANDPWK